jgi:iron complex outermembrane recepter protein
MHVPFQLKHSVGALLFAVVPPLMAQSSPQKNTDPVSHVIVSSGFMGKGYDVQNASSATRVSAPLIETPVSVDVVDQELIRDKAILSPGELANSVSGVQANGSIYGVGTSTNNFIVRGFSTNGINYRDGYRVNGIDTPTDMANVERVEFVKGPGSVLYGAAQPGGSVNTVTKKAVTDNFANVGVQAGSWSFLRSTLDMNQNFGDVSARVNIAGDKGNSYIDLQSSSNYLVAPSVSWRINKDLEVSYSGEFQKVNLHGGYTGLPSIQGVQNLKAGTNMGQPWTSQSNTNSTNQADIKYKIDQDWTFRQGFFNANYWASYSPMITPSMFVTLQGTITSANATLWNSSNASKNTSSQTELYGNVKTGNVSHKLMFGYEYAQTIYNWANQYNSLGAFGGIGPVNLANPAYQAPASFPGGPFPFAGGWTSTNTQKSNALYFQDQLAWGNWRLLAGIRNERVNSFDTFSSSQTETATTGRGGLLYMLTKATSVYYSISQSFTPNGSYRGTGGSILPSSRGLQNEVGVKHSFWEGLDATASLYQITRTNVPVSDGLGAYTVNGGEQSKGWEASLIGQATRSLRMIANASGINATTIQANTNYATGQLAPAGTQLAGVPKFSANIWGVQDLPLNMNGQASFGLGVVYVGDRVANTPNTNGLIIPSYTTVDAGLFYKIDRINLALNVKNLTNSTVLSSAQGAFVLRQPGISYLATAGINF